MLRRVIRLVIQKYVNPRVIRIVFPRVARFHRPEEHLETIRYHSESTFTTYPCQGCCRMVYLQQAVLQKMTLAISLRCSSCKTTGLWLLGIESSDWWSEVDAGNDICREDDGFQSNCFPACA